MRLLRNACATTARARRQATGARGEHVELAQLVDQTGASHPRGHRRQRGAERHRRQHQVLPGAHPGHRQPAQLDRKDNREHRAQPEIGHRDAGERDGHRQVIDGPAAIEGTQHAERDGNQDRDVIDTNASRAVGPMRWAISRATGVLYRNDVPRSPWTTPIMKLPVLFGQRTIQPELASQARQIRRRSGLAQHRLGRIPRYEMNQQKHHCRDASSTGRVRSRRRRR